MKSPSELKAGLDAERKLVLVGGALVLLGFFLPWFSVNPGHEVNRLTQQVGQVLPGLPEATADLRVPLGINTPSLNIAGPGIAHGLGWLVLVFGLMAVVLRFVALGLERQLQRTLALAALVLGTCLLLYLLSQNLHWVNAGMILALVGYGLEFLGILKDRTVQPPHAP